MEYNWAAMTQEQVKRPWVTTTQNSRKRARIQAPNTKSKKLPSPHARPISLDQLAWKEVALPDRFEDAEGFFGLEEIEDVEVVRDPGSGKVQYLVGKSMTTSMISFSETDPNS